MLVVCERWVGNGDRLPHIDPKFFWPEQHFFRILAGLLNRGSWEPKLFVWNWFSRRHLISSWNCNSNSNWPKPSVAPGYIIVWHPPASCGRTHLHRIQPRPQVKVIFRHPRLDAPFSSAYLHGCISLWTARSRANMQQSSHTYFFYSTCGIFLRVRFHPPHTHILQIMLQDNNRKNYKKKLLEPQQKIKKRN